MPRPQRIDIDDEHDTLQRPAATAPFGNFMAFAEAGWAWAAHMLAADPKPTKAEPEYRIGKYRIDYSQLTPEEIAQPDPEADALYKRSKPVSR
jgi:hypothetical protein